jgi:DNA repair exonuclease SbcCD ATPase subunit
VEKERSSRASAERSAAEASTRASTAETRVAELERSLASERAAVESARAEAETARAALSQASVSATATMEASQETSAALGSTRAALDAKEAELNSARAELESGSRLWDEEKKKVLGALAEIKKKMTKLERRRETLEAEVRAERTKRVETESKLETRLLEVTTELSDAKQLNDGGEGPRDGVPKSSRVFAGEQRCSDFESARGEEKQKRFFSRRVVG